MNQTESSFSAYAEANFGAIPLGALFGGQEPTGGLNASYGLPGSSHRTTAEREVVPVASPGSDVLGYDAVDELFTNMPADASQALDLRIFDSDMEAAEMAHAADAPIAPERENEAGIAAAAVAAAAHAAAYPMWELLPISEADLEALAAANAARELQSASEADIEELATASALVDIMPPPPPPMNDGDVAASIVTVLRAPAARPAGRAAPRLAGKADGGVQKKRRAGGGRKNSRCTFCVRAKSKCSGGVPGETPCDCCTRTMRRHPLHVCQWSSNAIGYRAAMAVAKAANVDK